MEVWKEEQGGLRKGKERFENIIKEEEEGEERKREEEELRKLKDKKNIWKFINRQRKKKEWNDNNIRKEIWRKHFKKLLGGEEIVAESERMKIERRKKKK